MCCGKKSSHTRIMLAPRKTDNITIRMNQCYCPVLENNYNEVFKHTKEINEAMKSLMRSWKIYAFGLES
jgi:hypothetical protein